MDFAAFSPSCPTKIPQTLILPEVTMHEVEGRGMCECMMET